MDWVNTYIFVLAVMVITRESCQLNINIGESPSCNESSKHMLSDSVQCITTCLTKNLPSEQDCSDQKNSSYRTEAIQRLNESMSTTTDGPLNYNSTRGPQTEEQNKADEKQIPLLKTGSSVSGQLLISHSYGISSIDVSNGKVFSTLVNDSTKSYNSVDYLYDEKLLFYSTYRTIIRANIEGTVLTDPVAIVDEFRPVGSVAVDWVNRRLYWTELETICAMDNVITSDLDGTNRRSLFENVTLCLKILQDDILVDPYSGFVFLITNDTVYKSNLDGSNGKKILEGNEDVRQVMSIALDRLNKKLYFQAMDFRDFYFGRVDYDGVEVIHKFPINLGITYLRLDVFGDTIFFERTDYITDLPQCQYMLSSLSTNWTGQPSPQDLYLPDFCHRIEKIKFYHPCAQSLSCEGKV